MAIPIEGISATGTGTSEDMGRTDGDPDIVIANYIYVFTGRSSWRLEFVSGEDHPESDRETP